MTESRGAGRGFSGSVLLAIDTSIGTSIALSAGDEVAEIGDPDERGHTEAIGGMLSRLLAETQVSSDRVAGVVVGIGPGPFTGLRIGIAAATAFATALGVPLLPISGHEAVAYEAMPDTADAPPVRVLQDARRRELFVTEYSGLDEVGLPERSTTPFLLSREEYVAEPRDVWPERIPASALLWLAELRLRNGRSFEPARALYLRAPDAKPAAAIKRVSS